MDLEFETIEEYRTRIVDDLIRLAELIPEEAGALVIKHTDLMNRAWELRSFPYYVVDQIAELEDLEFVDDTEDEDDNGWDDEE